MRLPLLRIALVWLTATSCCAMAHGDGGTLRLSGRHGRYQISVFTAPTPLRAGPVDISILVQDAETCQTVSDAQVFVTLEANDRAAPPIFAVATSEAATNKMLRDALVDVPYAGKWRVQVSCAMAGDVVTSRFTMAAAPPLPRWLTVWPWFGWPVVPVVLFGVHRYVVATRQTLSPALLSGESVSKIRTRRAERPNSSKENVT